MKAKRSNLNTLLFYTICFFPFSAACFQQTSAQEILWQPTNGPIGGTIRAIVVNSNGHIFAGVQDGGMFRSTDNGSTWKSLYNPEVSVIGLAINNNNDIFAIAGDRVIRSTDNGDTWQGADAGIYSSQKSSVFIRTNGDLFCSTEGSGIFRSTNDGISWINIGGIGLTDNFCHIFASFSDGLLLLGTDDGIFKSSDNGDSWIHTNLTGMIVRQLVIAGDSCIFAGHSTTNDTCVYKSLDTGITWTKSDSGITEKHIRSFIHASPGCLFAGTSLGGIFVSTNNGESWNVANVGLRGMSVRSFAIDSTFRVLAGTSYGVAASSDTGKSWTHIGVPHSIVYSVAISETGDLYASTGSGIHHSSDNGTSWNPTSLNLNAQLNCFTIQSREYVFSGGTYYSTNKGEQWNQINAGLSGGVKCFARDANDHIYTGTEYGIYRLNDGFDSWSRIGLDSFIVNSIANNPNNGMLFAGTERLRPYADNGIFRSTNDGLSWEQVIRDTVINRIVIHSNGYIMASTKSQTARIYRSTTNGDSWETVGEGINGNITSLVKNSSGHTFASTPNGVFRSTDYGASWANVSTGLPPLTIVDLTVSSTGFLFAGTLGNGAYKTQQTTVSVDENPLEVPSQILLYPNYPNPFNPVTRITYRLPNISIVSLKIYDILGRERAVLVNERQNAGTYKIQWDASRMPSGIYIARLNTGHYTAAQKLTLLK